MNMDRPAIKVIYRENTEGYLKEILAGIEEEGVLYETEVSEDISSEQMAIRASELSKLKVGIGIANTASLTDIRLEQEILIGTVCSDVKGLRNLGINAARLVKGTPLKL